jgi:hypothetical protein
MSITQPGPGTVNTAPPVDATTNISKIAGTTPTLIDGCLCVSAKDYFVGVAEGDVPLHSRRDLFGERAVGSTAGGEDLWAGTAAVQPNPADAGNYVSVVSTSTDDDTGGICARTVKILYVQPDGTETTTATIALDGTTPVDTGILMRFVQKMYVTSVGSTGVAVGAVKAYLTGTAGTVYEQIPAGANRSTSAHMMVPTGKTFYATEWFASGSGSKAVTIRLRASSLEDTTVPGVMYSHATVALQDDTYFRPFIVPHKFPALTVIRLRCLASAAGASVAGGVAGWLE